MQMDQVYPAGELCRQTERPPGREVMRDVIQLGIDARCDSAEPDTDFNAILA